MPSEEMQTESVVEIEELEGKIAPQSDTSFLD